MISPKFRGAGSPRRLECSAIWAPVTNLEVPIKWQLDTTAKYRGAGAGKIGKTMRMRKNGNNSALWLSRHKTDLTIRINLQKSNSITEVGSFTQLTAPAAGRGYNDWWGKTTLWDVFNAPRWTTLWLKLELGATTECWEHWGGHSAALLLAPDAEGVKLTRCAMWQPRTTLERGNQTIPGLRENIRYNEIVMLWLVVTERGPLIGGVWHLNWKWWEVSPRPGNIVARWTNDLWWSESCFLAGDVWCPDYALTNSTPTSNEEK